MLLRHILEQVGNNQCQFMSTKLYQQTLKQYSKDKRVLTALKQFILHKLDNPTAPYGSKDYHFSGNKYLVGYKHAGLTFDVSVVYTLSGKNPSTLTLYGLFTHDDLGTGQPTNPSRIEANGKRFDNQVPKELESF